MTTNEKFIVRKVDYRSRVATLKLAMTSPSLFND